KLKLKNVIDPNPDENTVSAHRKKSKVPGVMITQFMETLPEGKSHPDFTRKPIALTIQEGKFAFFKAIVTGDPKPTVKWSRNNGDVSDTSRYQTKYDPNSNEHTFEMPNVMPDQADTYKCFATNEYGQATVTVLLNIIEVGYKKNKSQQAAETVDGNFKTVRPKSEQPEKKEGEIDDKFWELLLSADKKDYESICAEYGITDFRWMLKKLNEMKKEQEEEQAEFVKNLSNLRPIQVHADGTASFELDMDLLEPSSSIFLYKDGIMIPYTKELGDKMKHSLRQIGRKYVFSMRDLMPEDAGLYQVDVEDVNMFSTDFKIPTVDFLVKMQEVKAKEREDAVFECVLTNPMSKILWFGKNMPLEQGDKYDIEVSEDKLIHRLVVKDCMVVDKGIYSACAGIKSCNAWLVVEGEKSSYRKRLPTFTRHSSEVGFERPPSILVPLKVHTPPKGYQLYMTCAVRGCPTPTVSWYLNDVLINQDSNYYITNAHGVCSLYIMRVRPVDSGEYKVVAVNTLGKAECSSKLVVKGKNEVTTIFKHFFAMI
uniref:Immunoglobulin-like and fibronectin type III domain-containing protein 1 n=1 Tax=Gouania willdenowi TaxID=441366 RepID=A0A8C5HLJ6_GOUWI